MDEPRSSLDTRARRALALMVAAALALGVAALLYLHPTPPPARAPVPPAGLSSLDWLSPTVGWAALRERATSRTVLYHTTDGGRHWTPEFATVADSVTVHFLDGQRGLLTERATDTDNPTVLRTYDGGEHWAPIQEPDVAGLHAAEPSSLDLDHVWVLMSLDQNPIARDVAVFRTADGGLDWTQMAGVDAVQPESAGLDETVTKGWLDFDTPLDGWLGAEAVDGSPVLYATHDGGATWRRIALPVPAGGWAPGEVMAPKPPRVSAGGAAALLVVDTTRIDQPAAGSRGGSPAYALASDDGGATWSRPVPVPFEADPGIPGTGFVDGRAGWLASASGLWTTADAGRTWVPATRPPGSGPVATIAAVDGDVAVVQVLTGQGPTPTWQLDLTEDAGRTWQRVPAPTLS